MKKTSFSLDSAVILAAITALLYTWSTAHYQGYLVSLRLDFDVMERNFHQILYNGLLISFFPMVVLACLGSFVLFTYSHLLIPFYVHQVRKSTRIKKSVVRYRISWFGRLNSPEIEVNAKGYFNQSLLVILFILFYLPSLIYFERLGVKRAKDLVANHYGGKNSAENMVNVKIQKKDKRLRFLGCGARNCAGIEEDTNLIFYYSISTGYSYLHREPKDSTNEKTDR